MKHVKEFETLKLTPNLGDYVICHENESDYDSATESSEDDNCNTFINNNVGKIVSVNYTKHFEYDVEYENIPANLQEYFRIDIREMSLKEILYCSNSKEELEMILNINKYNL